MTTPPTPPGDQGHPDRQPPSRLKRPGPRAVETGPQPKGGATLKSDNLRLPDPEAGKLPRSARNILSRDEIEALLNPDLGDLPAAPAAPRRSERAPPALISDHGADRARQLTEACDALVARLSHAFQARDAIGAILRLATAETRPFRATLEGHSGNGVIVCLSDPSGRVGTALVLVPEAASALIERAGGASERLALSAPARTLTALDEALLADGLRPLLDLFPQLGSVRVYGDRLRAAATLPPGEAVRLSLSLQIGTRVWPAMLLIDTECLREAGPDRVSQTGSGAQETGPEKGMDESSGPAGLTALMTARIASLTVPLSDLADLRPGATLRLGLPADTPVTLHSGDPTGPEIGRGALGREGDRIAIRLSRKTSAYS